MNCEDPKISKSSFCYSWVSFYFLFLCVCVHIVLRSLKLDFQHKQRMCPFREPKTHARQGLYLIVRNGLAFTSCTFLLSSCISQKTQMVKNTPALLQPFLGPRRCFKIRVGDEPRTWKDLWKDLGLAHSSRSQAQEISNGATMATKVSNEVATTLFEPKNSYYLSVQIGFWISYSILFFSRMHNPKKEKP